MSVGCRAQEFLRRTPGMAVTASGGKGNVHAAEIDKQVAARDQVSRISKQATASGFLNLQLTEWLVSIQA